MEKRRFCFKMLLLAGALWLAGKSTDVSAGVLAAEGAKEAGVSVEIVSPDRIESVPIYEGDVEIAVTNLSDIEQTNLNCFLTVVDEERKQSFPMDEFGPDSYQTRTIESLLPGETATIRIPLRVMYVGNFQLVANVVDYEANRVFAASSLPVCMISGTNLHRGLVIGVSAAIPVLLTGATLVLERKRGKRKKALD